jgi:hypothetical protein
MRLAVGQAAWTTETVTCHTGSSAEDEGMRTLHRRAGCGSDGGVTCVDVERHMQGAQTVRVHVHQRFLDDSAGCRRSAARAREVAEGRGAAPVDAELVDIVHGERKYAKGADDVFLSLVEVSESDVAA